MKKCSECKKNVAYNANTCPFCGYKFPNRAIGGLLMFLAVVLFFLFPFSPGFLSVIFFLAAIILGFIGLGKLLGLR